jgi:predicted esterase
MRVRMTWIRLELLAALLALAAAPALCADPTQPAGTILHQVWTDVPGTAVVDLTTDPNYPNYPATSNQLTKFEAPTGVGENYGAAIRGYVFPPATGMYAFYLTADDAAELWISTSDSNTSKVKIAAVGKPTTAQDWDKQPGQVSRTVMLVTGRRYYIEAIHKQGAGADLLAVGWRLPNGTMERPIAGNRLSPYVPPPVKARPYQPIKSGHHRMMFNAKANGRAFKMGYLLYIPKNYETTADFKPLLVNLHGAGTRGNDLNAILGESPEGKVMNDPQFRETYPFIGLSPQCPADMRWDDPGMPRAVVDLIDDVMAKYRVDKSRVYLTGLSMGGKGTWLVAHEAPDHFTALAPMSAVSVMPEKAAEHFKHMSVWIICGGNDGEFTSGSKQMYDVLKAGNVDVELACVPNEGHGIWSRYYNDDAFYAWLLKHKRQPAAVSAKR